MKKYLFILITFLATLSIHAQTLDEINDLIERERIAANQEDYQEAIRYNKMAKEAYGNKYSQKDEMYDMILYRLANYYAMLDSLDKAIEIKLQEVELVKQLKGDSHPDYATSLFNLADFYYYSGDSPTAIILGTSAVDIFKDTLEEDDPLYATSLINLADFYYSIDNYLMAVELCSRGIELLMSSSADNEAIISNSLSLLSKFLESLYYFAIDLGEQKKYKIAAYMMNVVKENYMEENETYFIINALLATYYSAHGDYNNAIKTELQAIDIAKRLTDNDNQQNYLIESLSNLADYYYLIGDYSKAIQVGLQVMEYRRSDPKQYSLSLNNLATYYARLCDHTKAFEYGYSALEIRRSLYGEYNFDYAFSLANIAAFYANIGDYTKAVKLGQQSVDILKSTIGENVNDSVRYATALANTAMYYSILGDTKKALEIETQVIGIRKSLHGENHPNYALSLANLAYYYSQLEDHTKALELDNKALSIRKESPGEGSPDYASSLSAIAKDYADLGNYPKAIELEKNALEIRHSSLGDYHPAHAESLSNLAGYYSEIGDYSNALHYLDKSLSIIQSNTFEQFTGLTSKQRIMLWKSHSHLFTNIYPSFLYSSQTKLSSDLYDKSALFAKGLLLSTEIEMNRLIQESGDEEALRMFEELQLNRLQLQKLYETSIAERQVNTDSLAQVVEEQERTLVKRSKVYGDFTRKLRTTWQEVQGALKEDEIAVEFLSFNVWGTDSTMVAALTLRKYDKEPKFIPLFEQKQLKTVSDTTYYHCPELTALVWQPLQQELQGIKRIYFSPAGALHNIGIEYAPGMESYEMYRLSTTREIITHPETQPKTHPDPPQGREKEAVLYGGVDYDASVSSNTPPSEGTGEASGISIALHRAFIDSLDIRGAKAKIQKLPGTKVEVEDIKRSFDNNHRPSTLHTGADATETSVKVISGTKPYILHIATHGFYFTDTQAKRQSLLRTIGEDDRYSVADLEDKALTRSGLLMAGVNVLKDKDLPMEADDGILTAQEISRLDLRGLDLVVLSACQTGKGDINQGEGVFGLQRGFKKAGAQTLVMSLWNVDDNATQIIMTAFYDNLLQGQSKRDAFHNAQQHLRTVDNGRYNEPQYWAAFILLD